MPVGYRLGGETPSSRIISARWRCGLDPAGCWSLASGDLQAPHTSLLSCPETTGAHDCRWPPLRCGRHGRQSGVTAGPEQTPVSSCAVAPGTTKGSVLNVE